MKRQRSASGYNVDEEGSHGRDRETEGRQGAFGLFPIERFGGKFPFYRQPNEVGHFSLDSQRKFHNDDRQLRLLEYQGELVNSEERTVSVGRGEKLTSLTRNRTLDLRIGYSEHVAKDEEVHERLDHLLQWIMLNERKFKLSGNDEHQGCQDSLNTDFISWRGHFTKFLCTPYENREPWQMAACLHKGTIFISEVETEYKRQQEQNRSDIQKEMCYWGYKFEDYMTKTKGKETDEATETGNKKSIVNTNEAFCTVVRTRLDRYSLVIGAEVDCQTSEEVSPPQNYVELKTSRELTTERQAHNFARFKLLKFWAQSFLAGVPRVVCGFRDDDGVVNEIKTYKTLGIPKLAPRSRNSWSAEVCMNFCKELLKWIKNVVTQEDPDVVYMFYFREPFRHIEYTVTTDGRDRFLPEWFTNLSDST